jgi:hypothetical protein
VARLCRTTEKHIYPRTIPKILYEILNRYAVCDNCFSMQYNSIMQTLQPDIFVKSPDGEYLMLVEVKLQDTRDSVNRAIESLKRSMVSFDCSLGLLVAGDRVILLRDTLEEYNGASIYIVGEAKLPTSLLPPADLPWQDGGGVEFESQVQNWLENLKLRSNVDKLPSDLKTLLGGAINLLQWGEVRAAGFRSKHSKAVK